MHLIKEIDALNADVVILGTHHVRIILKLLDVDHSDFRSAAVIVQHLGGLNIAGEGISAINTMNDQSSARKFALGLSKQIEPVNDEIKLRDDTPTLKVVRQKAGVVIGKCGFTTALSMPNDALMHSGIKRPLNRLSGEKLRIAHDVLLKTVSLVDVSDRKTQQKGQALAAKQRSTDAIGRCVEILVTEELRAVLDDVEVVVTQHIVFNSVIFSG
ncbi:hypothetical protein D3C78_1206770 [compost metagenome]